MHGNNYITSHKAGLATAIAKHPTCQLQSLILNPDMTISLKETHRPLGGTLSVFASFHPAKAHS